MMPAVITPFAVRYAANANGDIVFVANTLMTAPGSNTSAVAARNGTGSKLNNNDFSQVYVDVDSDASTFNSSTADLSLPAGGSVLFAGLYWGAQSSSPSRSKVLFKAPGATSYMSVAGSVVGAASSGDYQGFADVTALVKAGGVGTYAVANVQATQGTDQEAGWSLVVVYADPAATPRNLTVFDGFAVVDSGDSAVNINISGFKAPLSGPVNASIGFITYEGDKGYTGDSVTFNNVTLSDAQNPADNFFNSTISNRGSLVTARNPNYANQMGLDADIISKTGLIANGATTAKIKLTTGGETYYPGVVTTAIDLYAPIVNVAKSVVNTTRSDGSVQPGDVLEYTDTINVTGGEAATQFVYADPLSPNAMYMAGSLTINGVSASDAAGDDQADYQAALGKLVYRLGAGATSSAGGTLGVGQTATVKYRVVVNGTASNGDLIDSQGTASFVGQSTGANLSATSNQVRTIVARAADLVLTQTVDDSTPDVGQLVRIDLSVVNSEDYPVSGVAVKDLLPAGLTYVSSNPASGTSYDPATGIWTVGTVDGLSPVGLTIYARVVATSAVTNSATITASGQPDPNTSNNTATATLTPMVADLKIAKSVDVAKPNVGDTLTFTTTVTNQGPATASNVAIQDVLPAGFTFVSASGASYDAGTWSLASVPVGSVVLTIKATVADPSASTMTAKILSSDTYDPASANNTASVTVTPQKVDVSITKSVDVARPNVGGTVVLTTRVKNLGADAATGLVILSPVGTGLTIASVAAPAGTNYNQATGVWTVGSLAVSGELFLTVTATVAAPNLIVSSALLSHVDQFDRTAADDASSTTIAPQSADLAPKIAISDASPVAGQTVTLTVKVANSGPDAATNVKIAEALPAGFQYISSSADAGSYDATTKVWSIPTVASGSTKTLTIIAKVLAAGAATHTASVASADQYDPNAGNNSASVSSSAVQTDLALAAAFSNANPKVGDSVDYVVTLTSPGTADATGVEVSAPLPTGLTFVGSSATAGNYNSDTGVWDVGSVPKGASIVLTIRAKVGAAAISTTTATASLAPAPSTDAVASNNSASASLAAQSADLALTVAVDKPVPKMQDVMSFQITVTNRGPNDAANIVVHHQPIPFGLTFVGVSGPGTYVPGTDLWNLGSLALKPGQSATLTIQARPTDADPHTISANILSSDQYDANDANDAASVTYDAQEAELGVSIDVDETSPMPGQTVTIVVRLNNSGPDPATNVRIQTALPAGLSFVSASGIGTYRTADGVWLVGGLPAGSLGTASMTIKAVATGATPGLMSASILAQEQYDAIPDDDVAEVTVTPKVADLSVATVVDVARPNVGDVVTVTTTIANAGPSPAGNVVVRVPVPDGGTLDSSSVPGGTTYDPVAGTWTIPTQWTGEPSVLALRFLIQGPVVRPFIATIQSADAFDPDAADRTSSVAISPQQADLAVSASADVTRPNANQRVTFTFTLADVGPDPATGASVSIPLPAGYTFDSASATVGSYDSSTHLWTVGAVTPGTPVVLTLKAVVTAPVVPALVATIAGVDQYDPASANNSASVFIKPKKVDLVVGKVVSNPTPNVGDVIYYTLVVKNAGDDDATGVVLSDVLPVGMTYSSSAGDGAYDDSTGVWAVGSIAKGAEATLTLVVIVADADATVNTASVAVVDQFDVHSTNDNATTTVDPQQADLMLTSVVDDPSPMLGEVVAFTIDLKNLGKDDATGVSVKVVLPAGLEFDSVDVPAGSSYDDSTGVWTIGGLARGVKLSLKLRAKVASTAAVTLTASIDAHDQFDPNVNDDSASSTVHAQTADLGLHFSIDDSRPARNQVVTVALDLKNAGPDDATGASVALPIPVGFELISYDPSLGTYDPSTGIWTVGSLAAGSATRITLTLRTIAGDPITLTADAVADQYDPVPDDGHVAAVVTPLQSDLSIATAVDVARPNVGQVVAFTVTLTNSGPDAAANASVQALLPAGLEFAGWSATNGVYDSAAGAWSFSEAPSGSSSVLTIWARVTSASARTLTASIGGADSFDPDVENLESSSTVSPLSADVHVTTSVDDRHPNVGDLVTVTVKVSNLGPDAATGVALDSLLPTGLVPVGYTTDQGDFIAITGRWTIGDLPSGSQVTLVYQFRVVDPAEVSVATSLATLDQYDPTPEPTSTWTVVPRAADVALTITPSNSRPNVGDVVTFTIVAKNTGPDGANSLRIATGLGAGLTYDGVGLPTGTTFDPTTGVWTIPGLASGASLTLTLRARVTAAGSPRATAQVAAVEEYDPTTEDRSVATSVATRSVQLTLAETVDDAAPTAGKVVEFTVVVSNSGPDSASNVRIRQALPAGFEWASASSSGAAYDRATRTWTIPSIAAGGSVVLHLRGKVLAPGAKTVAAEVSSVDQHQAEPAATATVKVAPPVVNVGVTTNVDSTRPDAGQLVLVTVRAANSSSNRATGVSIATTLPSGLAFVSTDAGRGAYDAATGVWKPGRIEAGGAAVLRIWARATGSGTGVATARLASVAQFDATTADDSSSSTIAPHRADLSVRLEGLVSAITVGQKNDLRVIVSNSGPDSATGVLLPIAIPVGFRLVSHVDGAGSFNPTTGVWTVGSVGSGSSYVLTLTLEAIAPGMLDVAAGPASSQQFTTGGATSTPAVHAATQASAPVAPDDPAIPTTPTTPTTPAAATGSLSGVVYLDRNRNGVYDAGYDLGVATIQVIMVGTATDGQTVRLSTTTAADGSFRFQDLQPGKYSIIEQAPSRYFRPLRASVGSLGGVPVGSTQVAEARITAGSSGTGYTFGTSPIPGCRMNLLVSSRNPASVPRGPVLARFFPANHASRHIARTGNRQIRG